MQTGDSQKLYADLSLTLEEFWEDFTGVRPAHVRLIASEREIAVCLEEVLSPAEQQMVSTQTGRRVLQELGERIMEQARPQLQRLVEQALEEKAILAKVHLDIDSRSVLGFFRAE